MPILSTVESTFRRIAILRLSTGESRFRFGADNRDYSAPPSHNLPRARSRFDTADRPFGKARRWESGTATNLLAASCETRLLRHVWRPRSRDARGASAAALACGWTGPATAPGSPFRRLPPSLRTLFLTRLQAKDGGGEGAKAQRRDEKGVLYVVPSRLRGFSLNSALAGRGEGQSRLADIQTLRSAACRSRIERISSPRRQALDFPREDATVQGKEEAAGAAPLSCTFASSLQKTAPRRRGADRCARRASRVRTAQGIGRRDARLPGRFAFPTPSARAPATLQN